MLKERGIQGVRVLQGFVGLTKNYPAQAINQASKTALSANMFRLRPLRELINRTDQTELDFAEEHEIIRPLRDYQKFMTVSFKVTDERNDEDESTT
jgi:hypothetical protein